MWTNAVTCCADCIMLSPGRSISICHEVWSLSTVIHIQCTTNKELLQSGNVRQFQHMALTLTSGLLFLGQWHNTCKATNSTERIIQEPNSCHDNCKTVAKMRQVREGAEWLCQKIMTLKWNNCASFCVAATVIQIISMTWGTSLLEQSSVSFHCYTCCFISRSKVVSIWYNCSISMKFNISVSDHKIFICIGNGLFPRVFEM
jgi:hypothetical protein